MHVIFYIVGHNVKNGIYTITSGTHNMYLYVIYYIADLQCCVEGESRIGEVWD